MTDTDLVSPLGARREHAVKCIHCFRETWALSAVCLGCRADERDRERLSVEELRCDQQLDQADLLDYLTERGT